jgi:hypothetical protein
MKKYFLKERARAGCRPFLNFHEKMDRYGLKKEEFKETGGASSKGRDRQSITEPEMIFLTHDIRTRR